MTTDRRIVRTHRRVPTLTKNFGKHQQVLQMPFLIQMPRSSYDQFLNVGLRQLLEEISPIEDFTGSRLELRFGDYRLEEPKYSEREARDRDTTYAAALRVRVELLVKETGEVKEQELFMGDLPAMTSYGTFIINGAERVVVSQLVRSPGVYFTATPDPATGRRLTACKLIPNRGAWLEFETSNRDILSVKVDRKRRIPITVLLRAIDAEEGVPEEELGSEERVRALLEAVDTNPDHPYLDATLAKDPTTNRKEALEEFYRRAAPGRPADGGERAQPAGAALLHRPPLRPRSGGALQGEQAAGAGGRPRRTHAAPRRHRCHCAPTDPGQQRSQANRTILTTWATGACARWAS